MNDCICTGKRFAQSGLEEILLESDTVAGGSIASVMSGHHYNRSIRAHKLLAESLERLRWQGYIDKRGRNEMQ